MIGRFLRIATLGIGFGVLATETSPALADDFPTPPDTEPARELPLPPAEAAAGFRTTFGAKATVFAAEPDVRNPIGMAWDERGRLWVAENYTYAERAVKFDMKLRDRVVILEDRDADGKADRRTVFTDAVQRLTSVEVGHGGVWLLCPPQLLFMPDRDRNDIPDGPAEVVLDGFHIPPENYHNFANGLRWGPDGWLYGRCGCSAPGSLGAPGTPESERIPLRGGLWRYHPTRRSVEVLTHGTTNPWGHDWNALGETFFINTVNGHLWHAIPGAHFVRPHTIDPNPHAYELIDQHADHWHWDNSRDWTDSRSASGEHDRLGGGHAHSGMTIYQGGQWPAELEGALLTVNLHGRRINADRLERHGSGYVGGHMPDPASASDPWFRGVELGYGPDGALYVLDWSDTGECHESTGVHRSSGRVFRLAMPGAAVRRVADLARLDVSSLVSLQDDRNEWFARQSRRILAERHARGEPVEEARRLLRDRLDRADSPRAALRALWTLWAVGGVDRGLLAKLLGHGQESVRVWAIRLLTDGHRIDTVFSQRPPRDEPLASEVLDLLVQRARSDDSALARLALASTLQRLPLAQRARLAEPLLARSEDASDHNQPLMLWFGLMPLAESDPQELARLATVARIPTTRRLIARRLVEEGESRPGPVNLLVQKLAESDDDTFRHDVLKGLSEGLRGRRKATPPASWPRVTEKLAGPTAGPIRDLVRELSVVFGDGRALGEVRSLALDAKADLAARKAALETLIAADAPDLRQICEPLLRVRFLNTIAARGLTRFQDPRVGELLARSYRTFHPSERAPVLEALVSRPVFATALLERMAAGDIPKSDLQAFQARQIRSLGDASITRRLSEVWGEARDASADRGVEMARWKERLANANASGNASRGRLVFDKVCASCHTLYGRGGDAGPDLTGAGRQNLDYLLENIIDPGATVTADYRMVVIELTDGRVLNGIARAQTPRTLTLRTPTETLVIDRAEIAEQKSTTNSLMPDGLLTPLSEAETRDLFAYLMTQSQVQPASAP